MLLLQLIVSGWMILILIMSLVKIKYGVALFLVYMILVPAVMITIGDRVWGANVVNTAFLLSYIVYFIRNKRSVDWKPFLPFVVYFVMTLLIMPFQTGMPMIEMFDQWRKDVMMYLFLPFVMWNVMKDDPSSVKLFRNSVLVGVTVAVAYGLFLTTMPGENPYQMIMLLISGVGAEIDWYSYYGAFDSGRLFGRISSVFQHPMQFALFLGLSLIYLFGVRDKVPRKLFAILMLGLVVMSMICGVRSVLGGLAVAVAYYLVVGRNAKFFGALLVLAFVGILIVLQIPELAVYLGSIVDINNSTGAVSGSSIDMRLDQLYGAVEEADANPIWGLGYSWTTYYQTLFGNHPVCLAFESLLYVIICNFGISGFIIWGVMSVLIVWNNFRFDLKEKVVVDALFVFYIAYSSITGEYGYMKLFLIFYILLLGEKFEDEMEEESQKETIDAESREDSENNEVLKNGGGQ